MQNQLDMQANNKVKAFATELKQALVGAIQQGGFENAVEVCHSKAPEIASNLSRDGWTVARTSHRARNENNVPDAWELDRMQTFSEQYKAGTPANQLTFSKIEDEQYRFMKAIPTDKVCLGCHGSSVNPDLATKINALYPQDAAVGFSIEDLRGAFTLTKSLEDK
jgi:hypothetical protein